MKFINSKDLCDKGGESKHVKGKKIGFGLRKTKGGEG